MVAKHGRWTIDLPKVQEAETELLRRAKGCTRRDKLRYDRTILRMAPVSGKIIKNRNKKNKHSPKKLRDLQMRGSLIWRSLPFFR